MKWQDLVRGEQVIDSSSLSDPVLIRADGTYLYTLPSCVDDIDMNITHVVRGEDHVANTGAQIQIFEALGGTLPQFAHTNLLVSASGEGFSKRLGSLSIGTLAEQGLEALSVAIHAVLIGTSQSVAPVENMDALADIFDFSKVSRAPARFDVEELYALNQRIVQSLDFESVKDRLKNLLGKDDIEAAFWNAISGNIRFLKDAKEWDDVVYGSITPQMDDDDRDFIAQAAQLLPEGDFTQATWGEWTNMLKNETGRKGRALFMPLRKILTGREDGPSLDALLPLIGRKEAEIRLHAPLAR